MLTRQALYGKINSEHKEAAMLKFKNYLFDLDGTLTDPGSGIKNSIRYALHNFGLPVPSDEILNEFIGPPLVDSFKRFCGASDDDAKTLVTLYREYFAVKGYLENQLYPDTVQVLSTVKERGGRIFLATSKPEIYAVRILEHFDLIKYFDFCAGNDLEESRPTKSAVISYLIECADIDPQESLMVGDRRYDIEGAAVFSIPTAAVLHGYGSREELKNADYIIESFTDLLNI